MSSKAIDREQVESWLNSLRGERADIDGRIAPLLEEKDRLEEQERLLRSLMNSLEDQPSAEQESLARSLASGGTVKEYVEARVVEILEEAGEDRLHINQIHAGFREKGYEIPGAGKPVNITSHIRVSDRIKSPKRGYYGLMERVGDIPPRTTKKRRKGKKS